MNTTLEVCCGGVGSCAAALLTNPLDIMRTRMQVQGDLCKTGEAVKHYRNIPQGLLRVAREEGICALQKGLVASMLWQFSQNGLRIGLYPVLQRGWERVAEETKGALHVLVLPGDACRSTARHSVTMNTPTNSTSVQQECSSTNRIPSKEEGGMRHSHNANATISSRHPPHESTASASRERTNEIHVGGGGSSSRGDGEDRKTTRPSMLVSLAAGASSGAIGSFCASPFILVKTRLQSQRGDYGAACYFKNMHAGVPRGGSTAVGVSGGGPSPSAAFTAASASSSSSAATTSSAIKKTIGTQYSYHGIRDAFATIYATAGIRGLWHGSRTAIKRTMVGSSVQLVSYDYASRLLLFYGQQNRSSSSSPSLSAKDPLVHCTAAMLSSFMVVLFMNPFEVVMTRTYNHRAGDSNYGGTVRSAMAKVYRTEGIRGLYKGCGPMLARFAPHTVVSFVVYEWLRSQVGLSPSTAKNG